MIHFKKIISLAFKNKIFHYVFSRYIVYFIQFINSIFIAAFLGPYYLGIWGFVNLVLQYMNQLNLGISHAHNAIISIHKKHEWYIQKIAGTALSMYAFWSLLVVFFFIANAWFGFHIGEKFEFSKYAYIVITTGVLTYFTSITSGVFRTYGKLSEIAFSQTLFPVLALLSLFFFKEKNLLWALIISTFVSVLAAFLVYIKRMPIRIRPVFILRLCKYIQIKGWHLFVYNTSFYLIALSTNTFISGYYSVEEFGYLTFSATMANVGIALLNSFTFIIYPKLLNRFALSDSEKTVAVLRLIRDAYITTAHLLCYIVMLLFPLLLLFFPQYEPSKQAFYLISLTTILYTNSDGFSGLLIAKEQEKTLAYFTLLVLVINVGVAYMLAVVLKTPFQYIILATMTAYCFFVYGVGYLSRKYTGMKNKGLAFTQNVFPFQLLVPFILCLCLTFLKVSSYYFFFPVLLFLLLNRKRLVNLKEVGKTILHNPDFINI